MPLQSKNQNDIIDSELTNSYDIDYIFDDKPISRLKNNFKSEDKSILLEKLKDVILSRLLTPCAPKK